MPNPLFDALFGVHEGRDSPFLYLPDGKVLSYADFLGLAAQFAHALTARGLGPGDRLAVQVEKSASCLALYAAAVQAGVVFLPLNTAYTQSELAYFIENAGAALVICDEARRREIAPMTERLGASLDTLNADGGGSLSELAVGMNTFFPTVDRQDSDLAALLYTSGTTGRSKGAMLSHQNLLSNAEILTDAWRFDASDILLHALPIFHTHGLFVATNVVLRAGGAMIFLPKFDLDQVIDWLPCATTMMGVPTFYTRLLSDSRLDQDLVADMRLFTSGSAPLLEETHRAFEARTGHRILERYGMTETNMNTSNPYDGARKPGTVGPPLPGIELRITEPESGADVPQGETGMIEVRGPNVFQGYWQMPEKTAEELRDSGFFITGDLGRIDADGYVSIVGREKDLIISGGYNVYPKEVELVLDELPGILESAVIGVPHPDFGESPVAILVPETGVEPDLPQIESATADSLARYKRPKRYVVVDALPRNTMGKVQKAALRAEYAKLLTE